MIKLRRLLLAAMFLAAGAFAALNQAISIGAFSNADAAQSRIAEVKKHLMQDEAVAALIAAERFSFTVEQVKGLYRSELTGFADAGDLPVVMERVKGIVPDAYYVSRTTAASDTAAAPVPVQEEDGVFVVDETDAVVEEAPLAAAPEAAEVPAPVSAPEKVTPETAAVDELPAPAASTEVTASNDLPEPPLDGTSSMLLYSILLAAVALLILLYVARRKRTSSDFFPQHEKEDFEELAEKFAASSTTAHAPEAETAPEEPEAVESVPSEEHFEPEPTVEIEETPFFEEPAAEPEPVVFETPEETPAETIPETAEELPETPAAPAAAPAEAVSRKKRGLPADLGSVTKERLAEFAGNRLLIAEDNLINQKVISRLLEGSGMEIVIANNGQEALDMLNADPGYNMVLMDAHMPVMDGFEATRAIRQDPRFDAVPVVALSGDVGADDIRNMREAGMEEQLAKPLRVDALYEVMYQYLNLASEAAETAEDETLPELKTHEYDGVFNASVGLDICAGDKVMYAEILDEFVASYNEADNLVRTYIRANDDARLVAFMLDVKGVASNIGADALAEAAETLREAVLINRVEEYTKLADAFASTLHKTMAAIDSFKTTL
ncbi:response regulator [Sulfurimonas sp. HSL-3221]|uniref:response regulator n=1 Tax=Sulfurimonadaceae TaxID=2771471 RepID=UPI001E418F50|nr:response regulator [Sulfurimonas sp. HSL-3221]UFS61369.1 response regulator [Sulfurimonas sp. HSL-3221]